MTALVGKWIPLKRGLYVEPQANIKGTWTDVVVGGRYGINVNNNLYLDISMGFSGTYK